MGVRGEGGVRSGVRSGVRDRVRGGVRGGVRGRWGGSEVEGGGVE